MSFGGASVMPSTSFSILMFVLDKSPRSLTNGGSEGALLLKRSNIDLSDISGDARRRHRLFRQKVGLSNQGRIVKVNCGGFFENVFECFCFC